jgi:hypothetical protein
MKSQELPGRDTLWFAALLSGAYGSAAIALWFLAIDTMRGDPFFTPSLVGSVLLFGAQPSVDVPIRLDAVALYSMTHLALFVGLGTVATLAAIRWTTLVRRPELLTGGIVLALTVGVLLVGSVILPGLTTAVGIAPMLVGNVGAAIVIAGLIQSTLHPKAERTSIFPRLLDDPAR